MRLRSFRCTKSSAVDHFDKRFSKLKLSKAENSFTDVLFFSFIDLTDVLFQKILETHKNNTTCKNEKKLDD